MNFDNLSNVFSTIKNAEAVGKSECIVKPANSKVITEILKIIQKSGYIGEFESIDDGKGGYFKVNLLGNINDCRAIKPRHSVQKNDFVKFEKRYLPSMDFGILIISTSNGIQKHNDVKNKIGGVLLGYIY
ncbi:MAG: 30S ribosomal protein S8 [DPANN group archaeon]|nr:30S ribosomal protein S8 [DPANN group archaeon]